MRVLVIGSGGREHALAWRLSRSDSVSHVHVWPGNGGTQHAGWWVDDAPESRESEAAFIARLAPDLVVIGPEAPLVSGLADELRGLGLAVFGPDRGGARLEGSKIHAKQFMLRHAIPTARAVEVTDPGELERAIRELGGTCVLKADGLAAGKGVLLPRDRAEALEHGGAMLAGEAFGEAGRLLLVEERLEGHEVSLIAVCDGEDYFLLPPSQDHKRSLEGDRGPNTGGMGAYSPVPALPGDEAAALGEAIFGAALKGLRQEGVDYRGALYAGLMFTAAGPRVLEFNCRFGDPETQALLPRLQGDFGRLLASAAAGRLEREAVDLSEEAALTVVLASAGYPAAYETGLAITGWEEVASDAQQSPIFHAGTRWEGGRMLTAGGRVLAVTGLGRDLPQAAQRCYQRIDRIEFPGRRFRRDIGWRVLSRGGVA